MKKETGARIGFALALASTACTIAGGFALANALFAGAAPATNTAQAPQPVQQNIGLENPTFAYGETVCLPGDGLMANRHLVFWRKGNEPITLRERIIGDKVIEKMKSELSIAVTTGSPGPASSNTAQTMLDKFNAYFQAASGYTIPGYDVTWSNVGPMDRKYCKSFSRTDVTASPEKLPATFTHSL